MFYNLTSRYLVFAIFIFTLLLFCLCKKGDINKVVFH